MKQITDGRTLARLAAAEVKSSWLDRAVSWLSPAAGNRRYEAKLTAAYRASMVGGYEGGRRDKRSTRSWRPGDVSANEVLSFDLKDLRARSRDLVRNVPMATGAIATNVTNIVGDGLVLKPQPNVDRLGLTPEAADEWAKLVYEEWELFCERADFTGRVNFDEMQALVLRAVLEAGDVFAVRRKRTRAGDTYSLKIQLIEAERCSNENNGTDNPSQASGVALDGDGVPVAYFISDDYPDDSRKAVAAPRKWRRIPKTGIDGNPLTLHLFNPTRPDQARGLPYLAPVIEAVRQLGRYTSAEVDAAVINSFFTVILKPAVLGEDTDESIIGSNDSADVDDPLKEAKLGPGAFLEIPAGDDVVFADPKRPNTAFDAFTQAFTRQIGAALELPYEVLIKAFTASYSASRAALEMAWQFWKMRRCWLAWKFCQPVYEMFLTEAVATGRIAAPGFFTDPLIRAAWCYADWVGPARISLDPQKEAAADQLDLTMGVTTRDEIITRRTGGTFERKTEQLAREKELRETLGLDISPEKQAEMDAAAAGADPNADDENPDDEESDDAEQTES